MDKKDFQPNNRPIRRFQNNRFTQTTDALAAEAPLELWVATGRGTRHRQKLTTTLRSPTGHDFEWAVGFLWAENIIFKRTDVLSVRYMGSHDTPLTQVLVDLHPNIDIDWTRQNRFSFSNTACGVCGTTDFDHLERPLLQHPPLHPIAISASLLLEMPEKLRAAQSGFEATGGLHAAALFTPDGQLQQLREDIGRHNALDKLVGWAVLAEKMPLNDHILLLSGRIGFELVQKAVAAHIPIVAAIGAPSDLAIDYAVEYDVSLVGFLRAERFNIYSHGHRILE